MGHIRKAAGQTGLLVAGVAGAGEDVTDAHVVRETDSAGVFGRVIRQADGVLVAVALREQVQLIADGPRVHLHLEEELVHGQIERVHHPVLALVDQPERLALVGKELGTAVVRADGVGEHELLIIGERRVVHKGIGTQGGFLESVKMRECVACDGLDVRVVAGVIVGRVHPRRRRAAAIKADGEPERAGLAGGDFHQQSAAAAQAEREVLRPCFRQQGVDSERLPGADPGGVGDQGGAKPLTDADKTRHRVVQAAHGKVGVVPAVAEVRATRARPLPIVHRDLGQDGGQDSGHQVCVVPGVRVRHRAHR